MTDLIGWLKSGKGTWGDVNRLISGGEWGKIFLITNEFGKENFYNEKNAEMIVIDERKGLEDLRDDIYNILKDKVKDEVAINIISGTGKEHMAVIAAVLKLGVGLRFMALTKDGIKEI